MIIFIAPPHLREKHALGWLIGLLMAELRDNRPLNMGGEGEGSGDVEVEVVVVVVEEAEEEEEEEEEEVFRRVDLVVDIPRWKRGFRRGQIS
jgi:hypothetical protein